MIVFLLQFVLYIITLFPSTAQYRDSGEMVSAGHTLGIAHPPGYPLYVVISKIFILFIPFATEMYRLNVLSAVGSALAVWLLYKVFLAIAQTENLAVTNGVRVTAALSAMVFGTSYLQWYLSLVSEMYTLNTFMVVVLLFGIFTASDKSRPLPVKLLIATSFIMGIGLGVRMDLLLIAPAGLWLIWSRRSGLSARTFTAIGLSFFAGFSIFAYLYVRSNTFPMLDWNHPATMERLWSSIARKTHGGTLDLISENYVSGANFWVGMRLYFSHLLNGFAFLGIAVALYGLWKLWRRNLLYAQVVVIAWIVAGPLFIYLSNIPPNAHAFAILEAHFLFPNTIIAVLFIYGMFALMRAYGAGMAGIFAGALLSYNLASNLYSNNQRENYFDYDYVHNVLHSTPYNGTVVMKKDVQIFSIWAHESVLSHRAYPAFVAQGLCASQWYQEPFAKQYPNVFLGPLKSQEDWQVFYNANKSRGPVYFTGDVEYPSVAGLKTEPDGLLNRLCDYSDNALCGEVLLSEIYALRGLYDYSGHRDFFTNDLVGDYSRACFEIGATLSEQKQFEQARPWLRRSLAMQALEPNAANMLAYTYFMENKYKQAYNAYLIAAEQYRDYLKLAVQYRSLSGIQSSIRNDNAEAYMSAGVCLEKMGNLEESLGMYSRALGAEPMHARAYFNRSVIYWQRGDWPAVVRELQEALCIDPNYRDAAYYLQIAKQKLK